MHDQASSIPSNHFGVPYVEFVKLLSEAIDVGTYLEIGVQAGILFSQVKARNAIAVDPFFQLGPFVLQGKAVTHFYQMPSDQYFRKTKHKIDLGFLDGLHQFEFLLRDFMHSEKMSEENAILLLHDCLPLTAEMTHRDEVVAGQIGAKTAFPSYWTGDVWKVVKILLDYRPDLVVQCFDCPPTGLVCISKLDAQSTVLEDKYFEIVKKYASDPNDISALSLYYDSIEIIDSKDFLNRKLLSTLFL